MALAGLPNSSDNPEPQESEANNTKNMVSWAESLQLCKLESVSSRKQPLATSHGCHVGREALCSQICLYFYRHVKTVFYVQPLDL